MEKINLNLEIDKKTKNLFKAACAAKGVSQTKVLTEKMKEYTQQILGEK